jgi:lipopolysaccharide transport system permease protein
MSVGPSPTRPGPATEPAAPIDEPPLTVIEPRSGWRVLSLAELWRYRELLLFLAWRDVKVRYKQTLAGAAWAVVQPVAVMGVMALALGRVAAAADAAIPYWLFVLCGLVPWTFFAAVVNSTGQSVVANQHLVTKIYFPRLLLPLSAVGLCGLDFLIGLGLLAVAAVAAGMWPGWGLLALPLVVAALLLVAVGLGLLLAAATVRYRDFRVMLPLLLQLWLFLTPAIYLQAGVDFGPVGGAVVAANPVQGVVTNFRAAALGTPFDWPALAASAALGVVLSAAGMWYFRRAERAFADVI